MSKLVPLALSPMFKVGDIVEFENMGLWTIATVNDADRTVTLTPPRYPGPVVVSFFDPRLSLPVVPRRED